MYMDPPTDMLSDPPNNVYVISPPKSPVKMHMNPTPDIYVNPPAEMYKDCKNIFEGFMIKLLSLFCC